MGIFLAQSATRDNISGLRETFIKRYYTAKRTNKAEEEEQSEKAIKRDIRRSCIRPLFSTYWTRPLKGVRMQGKINYLVVRRGLCKEVGLPRL